MGLARCGRSIVDTSVGRGRIFFGPRPDGRKCDEYGAGAVRAQRAAPLPTMHRLYGITTGGRIRFGPFWGIFGAFLASGRDLSRPYGRPSGMSIKNGFSKKSGGDGHTPHSGKTVKHTSDPSHEGNRKTRKSFLMEQHNLPIHAFEHAEIVVHTRIDLRNGNRLSITTSI